MLHKILEALEMEERWKDNPLAVHIRPFATELIENGYATETIGSNLRLLADFGEWLGRRGLAARGVDESLIRKFSKPKSARRIRRGDLATLAQFLKIFEHAVSRQALSRLSTNPR